MNTEEFENKENQAKGGVNDLYFIPVNKNFVNETNIFDLKWWEKILNDDNDEKTNQKTKT